MLQPITLPRCSRQASAPAVPSLADRRSRAGGRKLMPMSRRPASTYAIAPCTHGGRQRSAAAPTSVRRRTARTFSGPAERGEPGRAPRRRRVVAASPAAFRTKAAPRTARREALREPRALRQLRDDRRRAGEEHADRPRSRGREPVNRPCFLVEPGQPADDQSASRRWRPSAASRAAVSGARRPTIAGRQQLLTARSPPPPGCAVRRSAGSSRRRAHPNPPTRHGGQCRRASRRRRARTARGVSRWPFIEWTTSARSAGGCCTASRACSASRDRPVRSSATDPHRDHHPVAAQGEPQQGRGAGQLVRAAPSAVPRRPVSVGHRATASSRSIPGSGAGTAPQASAAWSQ